ncbi:hypothetical protein CPAST_c25670 [Clostridium pasteurianum DSM 525 = ATCC 6013]|uniref:Uncharacterized protein n=1 Tax=Clostridium pasteurianum DSM 525 = ATCC 6013 TaxID=1262449 RepID=A0A0H3J3Y8_CLOPA|nr:hypothetical protein [Clostridium pasteurianum]AJA48636.1 hypothetical protein CPAST_c25670 [Clostridium pasteurianum DSM 525 = ATCC 6013]AJA52624.1 hypothetical protein CLPA_c25670 [Clostridium pasteurianum DSM 525 = ATCC 6013]AOZ75866.1 hypothetical protein AQ983_12475 [Clostridium pasteurianum DSM 525 = ATCC 6013]AOZ79662.1 hypothetical protein AQ984_12470 [Clostridium pasteurianum]ELP57883.1 hypothetical protein F502_16820 [Clostridium pasteurianum DSM 525 = ATCC 6013]
MRKMDEMELSINLKAIKWAWAYTIIFLFGWIVYDYLHGNRNSVSLFLLITQNFVWIAVQYFLKWKMNKDEK